ncbi:MAG: ABC transporter ATP-binding protein [Chitinophagales bacterium]|nr:ABC transporter ATP-binding protein [Chitinophagales bacterium]
MEVVPAIKVANLSFGYDVESSALFQNFNLNIAQGERFGLLGPNGAGKTTLMSLLTGVLQPNAGSVYIKQVDMAAQPMKAKSVFGLVPQAHSLYAELTAMENLLFFGAWSGMGTKEIKEKGTLLLHKMGLWEARNKLVSKFSGGMKSRLNLAIGVIHAPEILFLDEPTSAVDVQSRHAILSFLHELNTSGTTLVYTSHLLSEAEQLCTQIALMDNGSIMAQGTVQELLNSSGKDNLEALFLSLTGRNFRDN